ncbi:PREDICTED: E3 ubiquitin-protein ligase RFWD3-like [Nelumbo nucifera]|uniref:RING-type E3 ubiquitin transferase n=2 Tax=Nelumbo nucifera TaxID=4432 RepID=A0A1U7Z894_NELNU|nr:PREDICTED: E3 ubiquitin-protein ligase RFWD3-like [Nelumbo nucifera]
MSNSHLSYLPEDDETENEHEDEGEDEEEEEDDDDEDYVPPTGIDIVPQNPLSDFVQHASMENELQEQGADGFVPQVPANAAPQIIEVEDEEEQEEDRRRRREQGEASSSSSKRVVECEENNTTTQPNLNDVVGTSCSICMECWTSDGTHQSSCLPCGHVYGKSCIEQWIRQCGRHYGKCPQCNRRCTLKEIILLYPPPIVVVDQTMIESHEARIKSLESELEYYKFTLASRDMETNQLKAEVARLKNVSLGQSQEEPSEFIAMRERYQEECIYGQSLSSNIGQWGSPLCHFVLKEELGLAGARIFDIDTSSQILILARRLSGMGGAHVLTKISLMYPHENEDIQLPPSTRAVKDLHLSPSSGRLSLLAFLGKKLSVLSMESNNIVLSYDLPVSAWSCSWDLNSPHHIYAGLQNGMLLVFDMRQTSRPMESLNGIIEKPVHAIYSLVNDSAPPSGTRTVLSASAAGPCVWNVGDSGVRPFLVPELENQGVCMSLAYCSSTDDIVASFRPDGTTDSQLSPSPSPTALGQGIQGSHVLVKRIGSSGYQNLGSTSATISKIRIPRSTIVKVGACTTLFAYGDDINRELCLRELPSLRVIQKLQPHQYPILDVKYAHSSGPGLLGCMSEDKLQLFSARVS